MPNFGVKRQGLRRPLLGDMRHFIQIMNRKLTPPGGGEADFTEEMDVAWEVYAFVQTTGGEAMFDGVNVIRTLTYVFDIRFIQELETEESGDERWIKYLDDFYRVDSVEPLDDRSTWLRMYATKRGDVALAPNRA